MNHLIYLHSVILAVGFVGSQSLIYGGTQVTERMQQMSELTGSIFRFNQMPLIELPTQLLKHV